MALTPNEYTAKVVNSEKLAALKSQAGLSQLTATIVIVGRNLGKHCPKTGKASHEAKAAQKLGRIRD